MANKKINYNSKITACMHRPVTNGANKYVLYTKNKDYTGAFEGGTQAEQDPEYLKLSEVYANSPTNIRQVFITGRRVYTYLYSGIQVPSNRNSESVFMKTYEGEDNDMFEVARNYLKFEVYNSNPSMKATAGVIGDKEPDRYIIEGNILGVIANPYTCNNIEEIYLDWTIFLSNNPLIKQCFGDKYINPNAIATWLSGNYNYSEIVMKDNIQELFIQSCMGAAKNIRKRFPRLKMIAVITKLDELLTSAGNMVMLHTLDSELVESNQEKLGKTWYELNKARIQSSGSMCFLCPIGGADKSTFELKDAQYKFDRIKLKPKVQTFLEKLKAAERKARYGVNIESEDTKEDSNGDNTSTNLVDSERYLVELEAKYGITHVKNVLLIAIGGISQAELSTFFADFTKTNRQKYTSLVGLKM